MADLEKGSTVATVCPVARDAVMILGSGRGGGV